MKGRAYKVLSSKDHPWGLTQWASDLVCSKGGDGTFKGALGCYFHDVDWKKEIKERMESPLFEKLKGEKEFQGATFTVPFNLHHR